MTSTLIHGARLVSGGRVTPDAWVYLAGDRVETVDAGSGWVALLGQLEAAGETVDVVAADGAILTPGFVDIHGHGALGTGYESAPDLAAVQSAVAYHRAHGSTFQVLSLVTAPAEQLVTQLGLIAALTEQDPGVLGAHLEGPWLADSHRGAHDPTLLREPLPQELDGLVEAARGTLRQVTIAPELPGALTAIGRLVDRGVVVAVGHTGADLDTVRAAFDAGARLLTHACNGMPGLHHRDPGPLAAALTDERVTLEVINDGVHVHPAMVELLATCAPGRIALVTDAMAATGQPDGDYRLGSLPVTVRAGVARLRDGDSIAGSTLTLDRALRRAIQVVGLPLDQAVSAVTDIPARVIGRPDLGRLEVGAPAAAVLLNRDLSVREVWAAGLPVSPAPSGRARPPPAARRAPVG